MAITFDTVPSTLRIPTTVSEVVTSRSRDVSGLVEPALLIGGRTSAGTVAEGVPTKITSTSQGIAAFGEGSTLAQMVEAYRGVDKWGEVWAIACDDNGSGVAATWTLTFSGTATAAGTIYLYIAGQRVTATVASGDAATAVATAVNTAIGAATGLPVTSGVASAVVTLTARNDGPTGNDLDARVNYLGPAAGESLPAGISVAVAAGVTGATAPTVATAVTAMGDEPFDYIACAFSDATNVALLEAELDHTSGRWSPLREQYGFAVVGVRDTLANLQTYGGSRNAPHVCAIGYPASLEPPWVIAAQALARARVSMDAHPARPLTSLSLPGVRPAAAADRLTRSERNVLLGVGIATLREVAGTVQIERLITTYQTDADGSADPTWMDAQTSATAGRVVRAMKARVEADWPRHVLVADGAPVGAGVPATSPKAIKGSLVSVYRELEALAWVEGADDFADGCLVEKDGSDANRVNAQFLIDVANQARVVALRAVLTLDA